MVVSCSMEILLSSPTPRAVRRYLAQFLHARQRAGLR